MLTIELVHEYVARCLAAESAPRATELASQLSVSRDTLNRWARTALGRSAGDYLRERQIVHARGLLEQTGLPLTKVAYQAGFATRRALFRAFVRHTGVTPGRYRSSLTK